MRNVTREGTTQSAPSAAARSSTCKDIMEPINSELHERMPHLKEAFGRCATGMHHSLRDALPIELHGDAIASEQAPCQTVDWG